jgi:hypothetical protein
METKSRSYAVEFAAAIIGYALVLIASITLLNGLSHQSPWRVPLALAPMIPGIFVVVAVVRQMARMDELQRRMLLESLGIAFAGTAVITFGYGFLQNVGFPQVSWFAVWPIMGGLWVIGSLIAYLRYR